MALTRGDPEIRALGPYVVVRAETRPERTKGGVILPDSVRGPMPRGVVLHVGDGVDALKGIAAGQRVLFVCAAQAHEVGLGDLLYVVHQDAVVALLAPGFEIPEGV